MGGYLNAAHHLQGGGAEDTMLVIDRSGSMSYSMATPHGRERSRIAATRGACRRLLEVKRDRYLGDRVGVVSFASFGRDVHALVDVATHWRSLVACLDEVDPEGGTNIAQGLKTGYAALHDDITDTEAQRLSDWEFSKKRLRRFHRQADRQQRMIVLSDGTHNQGRVFGDPVKVAAELKQRRVHISCIGIADDPTDDEFDGVTLRRIASPGAYYFIRESEELVKRLERMALRLKGKE